MDPEKNYNYARKFEIAKVVCERGPVVVAVNVIARRHPHFMFHVVPVVSLHHHGDFAAIVDAGARTVVRGLHVTRNPKFILDVACQNLNTSAEAALPKVEPASGVGCMLLRPSPPVQDQGFALPCKTEKQVALATTT